MGFPYLFRGALDIHCRASTTQKDRLAHALADLCARGCADEVGLAYGKNSLWSRYIILDAFDAAIDATVNSRGRWHVQG